MLLNTNMNKLILKKSLLPKPMFVKIHIRNYPGDGVLSKILAQRIISSQALQEKSKLIQNKAILFKFCQHFKEKTLSQLLNDEVFIHHIASYINSEPSLYSRAFQLALEVTYSKRKFSHAELQEIYKNDFIVSDTFAINRGLCDQSTIYTSILAKKVSIYLNLNFNDIIVHSTPLFLQKENITSSIKNLMDYNKKMTENTCPDITLKNRPFDFKEQKDISFCKNQIYIIDKEVLAKKGIEIFLKLEKSLIMSKKFLSTEAQVYTDDLLKSLKQHRETQASIETRVECLNKFLLAHDVPKDFKMPLFIPIRKFKIEDITGEISSLDKIPLEQGHLDYTKAKKAIMGILEFNETNVKKNIQQITHNSIQFNISEIEEVD